MPILLALTVFIQACFLIHVYRTGRPYWWAFVILSFPVVGCIAYYFIEIFPGSREHRSARRAITELARTLHPDAELQKRSEELQVCGSVANKTALAEQCILAGMFAEAVTLYRSCLTGPYERDAHLQFGMARAHFHDGQFDLADQSLHQLAALDSAFRPDEVRLLAARILEGRGDLNAALLKYEELSQTAAGMEPKVRYGLLLERLGFTRQSRMVLEEVVKNARRNSNIETEREWIDTAKSRLISN
jgi:hypothetical protein